MHSFSASLFIADFLFQGMAIVSRRFLSLRDKWFLVLVTLLLQISVCWKYVHGNCDSSCPMVCSGISCPTSADPAVQINPLGPGTSCPEVVIYSVGYPTSYPGGTCEWKFDTTGSGFQASVMATFIDFDGESGDDVIIERTMVRPNSNIDTSNIFEGDVFELYNMFDGPFVFTRATMIRVEFRPQAARYDRRGLKLRLTFSEEDSEPACTSTQTFAMSVALPVAAMSSPRYPGTYPTNAECYYTVTSPADTHIILEVLGMLSLVNFQDYVYIYDSSDPTNPALLRIISGNRRISYRRFFTETNRVQLAFKDDGSGTSRRGFFMRATFEDAVQSCSGKGTQTDQCECFSVTGGSQCEVDGGTDFEVLPTPTDASQLDATCGFPVDVTLTTGANGYNAVLSSETYFDPSASGNECKWNFIGEKGQQYVIIFRDFNLDSLVDGLFIEYNDYRRAFAFLRLSGTNTNLPYLRDGSTFSLIGSPIKMDSHLFKVIYIGDTTDLTTFKGPLFEVHLISAEKCKEPCMNGGQCTAFCTCDQGFQGEWCEHTIPPDYTCLVKNHHVRANFAYASEIYAIAGTNYFAPESFQFDRVSPTDYQVDVLLPRSMITSLKYLYYERPGSVISLHTGCNAKDGQSRFGVYSCRFTGNNFVDSLKIPVIINSVSDLFSPVGRFTKTVSVNDAKVTLSVDPVPSKLSALRWRFNGRLVQKWNGQSSITITNVRREDGGFYECFIGFGEQAKYDVVTYRLIVRACPDGFYGPPGCTDVCPDCKNGGTCYDLDYGCICPPGYDGPTCEDLLTRSTVSRNYHYTCPGLGITYEGCKYVLICLPDPGGCMCMPGWTGNNCDQRCPPLKFGLECQFDCHCDSAAECDVATGECPGACEVPFVGPNCQQIVMEML